VKNAPGSSGSCLPLAFPTSSLRGQKILLSIKFLIASVCWRVVGWLNSPLRCALLGCLLLRNREKLIIIFKKG